MTIFKKQTLKKTIVLKMTIFKKRTLKKRSFLKTIVSFSIFCRRFHIETIVFLKNENVNIPVHSTIFIP